MLQYIPKQDAKMWGKMQKIKATSHSHLPLYEIDVNIPEIFLDNPFEVIFINNSSIADILAIVHIRQPKAVMSTNIYRNGQQNKASPVALLAYV